MENRTLYQINTVINTAQNINQVIFILDGFKQGCNKVVFTGGVGKELKDIFYAMFAAGTRFDFTIEKLLPDNACTINSITRYYGESITAPSGKELENLLNGIGLNGTVK